MSLQSLFKCLKRLFISKTYWKAIPQSPGRHIKPPLTIYFSSCVFLAFQLMQHFEIARIAPDCKNVIHGSHSLHNVLTWVTLFWLHFIPRQRSRYFFMKMLLPMIQTMVSMNYFLDMKSKKTCTQMIYRSKSHCEKRKERIGETMDEEEKKPDCVYVISS